MKKTRALCDHLLLNCVMNTLTDKISVNMAHINSEYISILKKNSVAIRENQDYKQYLKELIMNKLENVEIVNSFEKNKSAHVMLKSGISKAVHKAEKNELDIMTQFENVGKYVRKELSAYRNWSFTGSFTDFPNPPYTCFLIIYLK